MRTFILAYIFESKSQPRVLPLNNANLAKSPLSHHSQESKMVEVDYSRYFMSVQVTNTGQMSQQRVLPLRVTGPRHGADREEGVC